MPVRVGESGKNEEEKLPVKINAQDLAIKAKEGQVKTKLINIMSVSVDVGLSKVRKRQTGNERIGTQQKTDAFSSKGETCTMSQSPVCPLHRAETPGERGLWWQTDVLMH